MTVYTCRACSFGTFATFEDVDYCPQCGEAEIREYEYARKSYQQG